MFACQHVLWFSAEAKETSMVASRLVPVNSGRLKVVTMELYRSLKVKVDSWEKTIYILLDACT